ncbi:hypothetical protein QYE76_005814 [Lolium multiflorum]|uniref:Alpha/beta hydrolase fold-3 domain-containing protein n=1 Tax=Lolium multiflorum TaxID=4521 RepID=A0AAD8RVH5_LOLMU|nr:hypothetical protein QYE76_005814 [Lolium multiflorum]
MWARPWNGSDDGSLLLKVDELLLDAADGGLQLELLVRAVLVHDTTHILLFPAASPPSPRRVYLLEGGSLNIVVVLLLFDRIFFLRGAAASSACKTVPPCPSGDPATGVASNDFVLDRAASISARVYLPAAAAAEPSKKLPVVVFFHGGAFMIHTAASPIYHKYCASLAAAAPAIVVSVDYRLAPEHPVPAAYEDAFAALKAVVSSCRPDGAEPWLAAHGDASRVVLAGDSAGANMAHQTAVRLRKERVDEVSGVALLHSYFWGKEPVGGEPADAAVRGGIDRVWETGRWPAAASSGSTTRTSTRRRRSGGGSGAAARVLVATAELCWLVERSRAYAEGMAACGWEGELEFHETRGDGHVYFLLNPECDNAARELAVVAGFVRRC